MVMVGVWLLLLLLRRLRLLLDGVNNLLHQFNLLRSNLHPPTLVATGANSQLRLLKVRQQLNHLDGVPLLKVSKAHLLMVLRKHNPLDGVQLLPLPLLNLVWPNLLLAGVLRRLPSLNLPSLPADGVLQLRLPPTTTMDGALDLRCFPCPFVRTLTGRRWRSVEALASAWHPQQNHVTCIQMLLTFHELSFLFFSL
jgi:hypothetical protein